MWASTDCGLPVRYQGRPHDKAYAEDASKKSQPTQFNSSSTYNIDYSISTNSI